MAPTRQGRLLMTIPTSRVPLRVSEVGALQLSREEDDKKGEGDLHCSLLLL